MNPGFHTASSQRLCLEKYARSIIQENEKGFYVALNEGIWAQRDSYLRNLSLDSNSAAYKFGTNVVIHLLTRWDNRPGMHSSL